MKPIPKLFLKNHFFKFTYLIFIIVFTYLWSWHPMNLKLFHYVIRALNFIHKAHVETVFLSTHKI
jgi:hypothetical protein